MSYLADVEMPPTQEEPGLDELEVREDVEISELDEDEDEGVEEELSPLPPPPQKKDKLKSEDIFRPKQAPPKKVKAEPEFVAEEPIIPKITPVKEKKKRVLSDKQKEALAKGRAKRAANKKAKQEQQEPKQAQQTQEQIQEAPLTKSEPVTKEYIKNNHSATASNGITDEKLQELIFQGVQQYDTMRKKRKAQKRETQAKQQHENKVFNDINSALNRTSDPWASAFNF
jgi:hypothetical protein